MEFRLYPIKKGTGHRVISVAIFSDWTWALESYVRKRMTPTVKDQWKPVREVFLSREDRPSFSELAAEFGIEEKRIERAATDQGWVILRAKKSAELLERTDAHEKILMAAALQTAVTDRFSVMAILTLEGLGKSLADLEKDTERAPAGRTNILNTVSFTLANLARGLKDAGIMGIPRALAESLKDGAPKGAEGEEYLKRALHQINLTVNLAREGKPTDTVVLEPIPVKELRKAHLARDVTIPQAHTPDSISVSRMIRQAEKDSEARRLAESEVL